MIFFVWKWFSVHECIDNFNVIMRIFVGGKAENFEEGIKLAREIIESGAAQKKLAELVEESNKFAQ